MPKLTKKQSRDSAQKSDETDADNELVGATAPPSASSSASEGGATASPQSLRTEEEWTELVLALQEIRVANAELTRANAELQLKLREEMAAAALRSRNPQRSHRSTSTEGRPCQETPPGCPPEGNRPHSIASSAPHQARESNCRVDQYFQVPPVLSPLQIFYICLRFFYCTYMRSGRYTSSYQKTVFKFIFDIDFFISILGKNPNTVVCLACPLERAVQCG